MSGKLILALIAVSVLGQTACRGDSVVSPSLTYEIVANPADGPVQFVVTRHKTSWEVHFRKPNERVKLEAVSVLSAKQPITMISDPHSTLLTIQHENALSLDFFISFEKDLLKNECLYVAFQVRKSPAETIRYLVRIDELAARQAVEPTRARAVANNVIAQAKAAGIEFEFASDKRRYVAGDPITIIVHAVNQSDREVVLRPRSTYPSLFDFGILDNGKHLPWTLNMAMNFRVDQTVAVPARSRILWSKENIVETTRSGDGSSVFSAKGKHVLSFGTGDSVEITIE